MEKESVFGGFVKKLADNKRLERAVFVGVIIVGCLVFLMSGVLSGREAKIEVPSSERSISDASREELLERRLENILSSIEGVGKVRVMISFGSGLGDEQQQGSDSLLGFAGYTTAPNKLDANGVTGVIAVCEGAGNAYVTEQVRNALMTLLSLNPAQICVFQMQ